MGLITGFIGQIVVWTWRALIAYALVFYLFGFPAGSGGAWRTIETEIAGCAGAPAACLAESGDGRLALMAGETRLLLTDGAEWARGLAAEHELGVQARHLAADALDDGARRLRAASEGLRAARPETPAQR